jgi:plastocyanin
MTLARAWSRRALLLAALGVLGWGAVSARAATWAAPAGKTVAVVIDGAAFAPRDVTAQVGDTVAWTNKDVVDHTATAQHGEWRVDIKAGKTATLVLKKAGSFDYYCEFHPNMTAHLTVKPAAH